MGACGSKLELALESIDVKGDVQKAAQLLLIFYQNYDNMDGGSRSKYDSLIIDLLQSVAGNVPASAHSPPSNPPS